MYIRNEYDLGRVIQVENHYPGNYGAPGKGRAPKRKRTPEDIERQNRTNREKHIQRLILLNFKEGDWHLILKYKPGERPETYERAKKNLKNFLDKIRRVYKKKGYQLKFIAVTERGKKGQALHHHIIIEDIKTEDLNTVDLIKKMWPGFKTFIDLYEDGDFENLAQYIVKIETKEEEEKGKATYSRSRNLKIPKAKRKKLHRKKWPDEPKSKKGYMIIKESVYNGINPVTGYPYQHYSMKKIEPGVQRRDPGGGSG